MGKKKKCTSWAHVHFNHTAAPLAPVQVCVTSNLKLIRSFLLSLTFQRALSEHLLGKKLTKKKMLLIDQRSHLHTKRRKEEEEAKPRGRIAVVWPTFFIIFVAAKVQTQLFVDCRRCACKRKLVVATLPPVAYLCHLSQLLSQLLALLTWSSIISTLQRLLSRAEGLTKHVGPMAARQVVWKLLALASRKRRRRFFFFTRSISLVYCRLDVVSKSE